MLHLSADTEALARRIASAQHISVERAIKLAIEAAARMGSEAPANAALDRDELVRRMEAISARSGSRPLVDPRSHDELLGYDEFGLPR